MYYRGVHRVFQKGVSKEGVAKAISTTRFVPACAWCAQALCAQVRDAQGGFPETPETPLRTPLYYVAKTKEST